MQANATVCILASVKEKKMGRPPTKPARLRDGFYIEVRNSGSQGIRIRRDTREQMLLAPEDYSRTKDVVILGEMKDDKWIDQ